MPIFEYICKECDHAFEAIVNGGAKPVCPKCEGKKLEQQFSSFAVGAAKGKGRFSKSAPGAHSHGGACGSCGDPRGPGSCSN